MKPDIVRQPPRVDVPWDDLREQRVLGRVLEARKRPRAPARLRWVMVAAAAMIVVGVISGVFVLRRGAPNPLAVTSAPGSSSSGTTPAIEQRMALADGSTAVLLRGAEVRVDEQQPRIVRISQSRGAVRYEVRPDPSREFRVQAGTTTVMVRGTAFVVDMQVDAVEVRVEHGRVEVDDGTRRRDLVDGESLRTPVSVVPPRASDTPSTTASAPTAATPPAAPSSSGGGDDDTAGKEAPTAAALQARADAARQSGRNGEAAEALATLVRLYPRDPRVPAALFSLARVERARGQHEAAARTFRRCAASGGPLSGEALAEAATSWKAAGSMAQARADAAKYLARFPNGPSAARMQSIVDP